MPSKVWGEITYPFPNFNGCTVELWEWISNSISPFYDGCNYLSMMGLKFNYINKRGPWTPLAPSSTIIYSWHPSIKQHTNISWTSVGTVMTLTIMSHDCLTLKHREMHGYVVSTVATDAKSPGHQYHQCWLNIHCIGPVSYENITLMLENIRKSNYI